MESVILGRGEYVIGSAIRRDGIRELYFNRIAIPQKVGSAPALFHTGESVFRIIVETDEAWYVLLQVLLSLRPSVSRWRQKLASVFDEKIHPMARVIYAAKTRKYLKLVRSYRQHDGRFFGSR